MKFNEKVFLYGKDCLDKKLKLKSYSKPQIYKFGNHNPNEERNLFTSARICCLKTTVVQTDETISYR